MRPELSERAFAVLRGATVALLRRDVDAFDRFCAPWFQGHGIRLLAALDEEVPYPDEGMAFPSRFVLGREWLDTDDETLAEELAHDQREEDIHPVHRISREVTPANLVGFPRVDVYGAMHPDYDIGFKAELYFTLAEHAGEIVVAHAWVNNYDGDDDFDTVQDFEDLDPASQS